MYNNNYYYIAERVSSFHSNYKGIFMYIYDMITYIMNM